MKVIIPSKRLYEPPVGDDTPPGWIKWAIRLTCGGVSYFHGSNDGQKGMGLLMLVLIGFMPTLYALHPSESTEVKKVVDAVAAMKERIKPEELEKLKKEAEAKGTKTDFDIVEEKLSHLPKFHDLANDDRWMIRQAITHLSKLKVGSGDNKKPLATKDEVKILDGSVQYVPLWVVVMTALCLGIGTMIGYKRIVVTVAEKIGKTHLTYAQGMTAEFVAAVTICLATYFKLPVSTTHVLSSGVAGTMAANKSGLQMGTVKKIALAWICTLPACMALAGGLFAIGWVFLKK
jgi:phosphate/sulfate permease